MKSFLAVLRDIGLLVVRLALGGVLVMRGWRTWMNDGVQAEVNHLIDLGMPQPQLMAWAFLIIQLAGGLLLIVGLLTPIAGLLVLIMSGLMIGFGEFTNGLWVENNGYEYTLVTGALALIFTVFGGGRAALDMLFKRDPTPADDDVFTVDDTTPA